MCSTGGNLVGFVNASADKEKEANQRSSNELIHPHKGMRTHCLHHTVCIEDTEAVILTEYRQF